MTDPSINGIEIAFIIDYMKGIQTDQFHYLVMGEEDPHLFNPNALRQIVRKLKELEEAFDDERAIPRFDFDDVYKSAEKLIEMLEH